jgi:hypothetical protein
VLMKPITLAPFSICRSYFHSQEKPPVTGDINFVCPHVQHNQLKSDPSKTFHESFAFTFLDRSIEAYDYLGDGEDSFGEFDESHESVNVRYV